MIALLLAAMLAICPPWGDATAPHLKAQNVLKNRTERPTAYLGLTVAQLLAAADQPKRYSPRSGVTLTGYLRSLKRGGPESCNCHAKGPANEDWHLELVARRGDGGSAAAIAEVTPRLKPRGIASYAALKSLVGQRVTVKGWLFFDAQHATVRTWRGTAYEVHPVTEVQAE